MTDRLPRFTPAERWVHRTTAVLVAILVVTAAILYDGALAVVVGRRTLVEGVHVAAGFALPVPTLIGLLSPAFRTDAAALGRFLPGDREWLRRPDRRTAGITPGKFNAGQKLAASLVAGAGVTLFATGIVMLGPTVWDVPVGWRQGATLVHDVLALGLIALLLGHITMAYARPEARKALRTGAMATHYAGREYPAWAAAQEQALEHPRRP